MTATNAPQRAGALDGSGHSRILSRVVLVGCVLALILGITVYCHARETDAQKCSQWEIVFDGYGEASCSDGLLRLKPTSANSQDKTHAGLAKSTTVEIGAGNVQTIHTRDDGAQRFLASGNTPVYPPGTSHNVTVTIDTTNPAAATFVVTVDGQELGKVTDSESPYRSGAVAAYCEDSDVTFTPITEDQ